MIRLKELLALNEKQTVLTEARKQDIKYVEKKVQGVLDRVTAELSGADSGVMTRLGNRYKRLDRTAKLLKEKRDEANARAKEIVEGMFNAEDEVLTRVVDTVSLTLTLSKFVSGASKDPTKTVNYEGAFAEIAKLVPELEEQMKAIIDKYTTTEKATDTPVKLLVKHKENKVDEGLVGDMIDAIKSFTRKIFSWGDAYGEKLNAIKKKYKIR